MLTFDQHGVPFFHTLESIERINKHIALHQSAEHPDKLAIEQWQHIRLDLQRQLQEMLTDLNILPPLVERVKNTKAKSRMLESVMEDKSLRKVTNVEREPRETRLAASRSRMQLEDDKAITRSSTKSKTGNKK